MFTNIDIIEIIHQYCFILFNSISRFFFVMFVDYHRYLYVISVYILRTVLMMYWMTHYKIMMDHKISV